MISQLIKSDFLKLKRKGFWFLAFLGPFGVVALQVVNYSLRKDYLLTLSEDDWAFYISNVHGFTPLALVLGIAILTSLMTSIENETNAWKQLIALPVSKMNVYLSKFTVLTFLFWVSSCLLFVFTLAYGLVLDLGEDIPYKLILQYGFYPFFAALPVLALQLWVATVSHNQAIPITTGIFGVILTFSAAQLPNWVIWKWPYLLQDGGNLITNVYLGIGFGLLLYIFGMLDFTRRDVK